MGMEDLDAFVGTIASPDSSRLRASLNAAADVEPDHYAAVVRQGWNLGIPTSLVPPQKGDQRRLAMSSDLDTLELPQRAPVTARFLSDQENAKVAYDDRGNLSAIEQVFKPFMGVIAPLMSGASGFAEGGNKLVDLGQNVSEGLGFGRSAFFDRVTRGSRADIKQAEQYWNALTQKYGFDPQSIPSRIYQGIGSAPAGITQWTLDRVMAPVEGYGKNGFTGAATESAKRFGLGKIFHGIGATSLGSAGRAAAMGGTMGVQSLAEGQDLTTAVAATVTGAALSMDSMNGKQEAIRQELIRSGADAQQASRLAALAPVINPVMQDAVAAKEAQLTRDFFDALGEAAGESKLLQRLPEKMRDFVAEMKQGGAIDNVYVPVDRWNSYWQEAGKDPSAMADAVTGGRQQHLEALATGGDVAVPLEDFVSKLAGSEHYRGLSDDVRLRPGAMTAREATEFEGQFPERMRELQDMMATGEGARAPRHKVYDLVPDAQVHDDQKVSGHVAASKIAGHPEALSEGAATFNQTISPDAAAVTIPLPDQRPTSSGGDLGQSGEPMGRMGIDRKSMGNEEARRLPQDSGRTAFPDDAGRTVAAGGTGEHYQAVDSNASSDIMDPQNHEHDPRRLSFDFREGTSDEEKRLATELAVSVPSPGLRNRAAGSLLANAISTGLRQKGAFSFIGQKISSAADLAAIAQVYRNPSFETLRYFFVKNDAVVGQSGVTSRLPGVTSAFPSSQPDLVSWLRSEIDSCGADGFWMIHNHPSGIPKASRQDLAVTSKIKSEFPGFKGHVIINHNRYGLIAPDGSHSVTEQIFDNAAHDILTPSLPHPILGRKITSPDDIVRVGYELQIKDGHFLVISQRGMSGVSGLIEIPVSASKIEIAKTLRRFSLDTGGQVLFAVLPKASSRDMGPERRDELKSWAMDAVTSGFLVDAVDENGFSVFPPTTAPSERQFFGRQIKGYRASDPGPEYSNGMPGAMTAREATEFEGRFPERMGERRDMVARWESAKASWQRVYDDVFGQLRGIYPRDVAEKFAALRATRIRARAERLGRDPFELYMERPFTINNPAPGRERGTLPARQKAPVETWEPEPLEDNQ